MHIKIIVEDRKLSKKTKCFAIVLSVASYAKF